MGNTQQFGRKGESDARVFLESKGLEWVTSNYHSRFGEIDHIFYDPNEKEYVLVEVKARNSLFFGKPQESVTPQKLKKIERTAHHFFWYAPRPYDTQEFRIDVVCITQKTIEYFTNVSPYYR